MKFEIPESIADLDLDALNALIADARTAAADLVKDDEPSSEDIEQAEAIVDFIAKAQARVSAIEVAEQEKTDRIAAIRAASEAPAEDEDDDKPESDKSEADEPVDENQDEPGGEAEAEPEDSTEDTHEEEKVAVAASAKTSAVARAAQKAKPITPRLNSNPISIVASTDISGAGVQAGQKFDGLDGVVKAATKRLSQYPKGKSSSVRMQNGIAQFNVHEARTDGLYQGNRDFKDDHAIIMAASKEARLQSAKGAGSLTAAGGWCAPSETLMDFCVEESTDGILDLPSITVNAGSVRWTKGPDFSSIYANANGDWHLTEADVIADTEKPCIPVECAPFTETTLDVTGVCISAGILTQSAYPELVRRYIEAVLIAHEHKVGERLYQAIDSAATALTIAGAVTAYDSLTHVEYAIMFMRESKRMSMNTTMEVLAPHWYKAVIRGDLARRNGVDLLNVSDAQIQSYFASRGASVQWLYGTGQDIVNGGGSDPAGTLTIPATVDLLVYPAGSFVKLTTDLITLEGIYDTAMLKTNTYTALFTEEGYAVVNPCGDAYKVTVETCITGQTGAADLATCLIGQATP